MLIIIFMNIFCEENLKPPLFSELFTSLHHVLGGATPVIVCIGTDAVVGDSLGPLVGSMLKEKLAGKTYVFGTVESPITAKEVASVADFVKNVYPDVPILAIDAALGSREEIGVVKVIKKSIKPGLGVDKDLAEVGSASIIGIVEERERGKRCLSTVRLSLVYSQAKFIAAEIEKYIRSCSARQSKIIGKVL